MNQSFNGKWQHDPNCLERSWIGKNNYLHFFIYSICDRHHEKMATTLTMRNLEGEKNYSIFGILLCITSCFSIYHWQMTNELTGRPKSVRNRCVIKVFGGVFYVGFFCGCKGFCHRTESDLCLFLLLPCPDRSWVCQSNDFHIHSSLSIYSVRCRDQDQSLESEWLMNIHTPTYRTLT